MKRLKFNQNVQFTRATSGEIAAALIHITLSGRNNQKEPRTVFLNHTDTELGTVVPVRIQTHVDADSGEPVFAETWEAFDCNGTSHGDSWVSDWAAAEALLRVRPR